MRVLTEGADTAGSEPAGQQRSLTAAARKPAWLGQMVASVCWIISVFVYGISSAGDWLQLAAASSWAVANIAALLTDG